MQDTIDQILDLTSKFLINEYNFSADVHPSIRFIKADQEYKDLTQNDYRGVQLFIKGSFDHDGNTYTAVESALTVYADATYDEAIALALEEMRNPNPNTRWCIERLIIQPAIQKSKELELV